MSTTTSAHLASTSTPATRAKPIDADRHERRLRAWGILCAATLLTALAYPWLAGLVYTADDLGAFHLPLRKLYADHLATGHILTWTSHLFGGFYVAGEGQLGAFHPLHILLYRLFSLRTAFCIEVWINYPLMLAGMYLFLRSRLRRRDAAIFGALVFTFTGFNLLHIVHINGVAVLAHLPWLLWAIDRLFAASTRRRRTLAATAIALLTASQLLLGYPQFVWFSLVTELAFVFYLMRFELGTGRALLDYAIATALAFGLAAVQLLPTLDVLASSLRGDITRDALLAGSMHPWNLAQLVGPYLFTGRTLHGNTHEFTLYVGAVPLLLAVWLTENLRATRRSRFAVALYAFAAVALLLTLGRHGYLYELHSWLPIVGKFRFPSRFAVLFALAIAALSAIALAELASHCRQRGMRPPQMAMPYRFRWSLCVVLLSIALPAAAIAFWDPQFANSGWPLLAGPLLLTATLLLIVAATRQQQLALYGLVLLAAVDLGLYGLTYAAWRAEPLDRFAASTPAPAGNPGDRVVFELAHDGPLRTGNALLLQDYERVDGYAGLEPRPQGNLRSLAGLQEASVRWVAQTPESAAIAGLLPHDEHWFEVPHPLPKARFLPEPGGTLGIVESFVEQPGQLELIVNCPQPQTLIIAQRAHAGWRATLNGQPLAAVPPSIASLEGEFLACPVPAGRNRVQWQFQPDSLLWGLRVSLASLAVLAVWCAVGVRRR